MLFPFMHNPEKSMTRMRELMAAGVNVAFGHDCVLAPWYGVCCDYSSRWCR